MPREEASNFQFIWFQFIWCSEFCNDSWLEWPLVFQLWLMCLWWRLSTEVQVCGYGKNGGVYHVENALWIYAKCGICFHLLVFTNRKIEGFPIVLPSVNLSIRFIIFLEFIGLLTFGECLVCLCSQMFSRCKTSRSARVYNWKPAFSHVFQNGKCR